MRGSSLNFVIGRMQREFFVYGMELGYGGIVRGDSRRGYNLVWRFSVVI